MPLPNPPRAEEVALNVSFQGGTTFKCLYIYPCSAYTYIDIHIYIYIDKSETYVLNLFTNMYDLQIYVISVCVFAFLIPMNKQLYIQVN